MLRCTHANFGRSVCVHLSRNLHIQCVHLSTKECVNLYPSKYLSLPLPPSVVRAAAVMLFSLTGAFCQLYSCLYAKERSNGTMRIVWFMVGILMSLKKLGHPQNQFSCRCWQDNYLGLMSLLLQCFWLPWGV